MNQAAQGGPERRATLTQDIMERTGITEEMIAALVDTFYARVRADALLAPVFAAKVEDWDAHLAKLRTFWSSVALMSGRYHGQPMQAHATLDVTTAHFDRWLALFERTAQEICPPAAAAHFIDKARRIADSLELGIAARQGRIATPTRSRPAHVVTG